MNLFLVNFLVPLLNSQETDDLLSQVRLSRENDTSDGKLKYPLLFTIYEIDQSGF